MSDIPWRKTQIRVSSLARAEEVAKDWADRVVSLVSPNEELPNFHIFHLVVHMDDCVISTDPWSPKLQDVQQVFDFCLTHLNILVHCMGGISRSTAMAIGLWIREGKTVEEAVLLVAQDSPGLSPNRLILQHIDTHLKLGGTLVKDVQKVLDTLPKDLILWCDQCKVYFTDGENCPGKHFL